MSQKLQDAENALLNKTWRLSAAQAQLGLYQEIVEYLTTEVTDLTATRDSIKVSEQTAEVVPKI